MTLTSTDWVYISCTFSLAVTALVAPYISELIKRKCFAPKLKIILQKESPYIWDSERSDILYNIFFGVKNEGISKVKNCEVIIEEFYFKNKKGDLIKNDRDFPAQLILRYGSKDYLGPADILPKANKFFNLFYIVTSTERGHQDELLFFMDMEKIVPSAKSDRISVPLNYLKIKIVIYSENAKKYEQYIEIKSPGIKREKKEDSLQELQIELL